MRLRELLAERDAEIARLRTQLAQTAGLRQLVTDLQAQVADLAARVKQNSKNSSRPPYSDGLGKPAPKSLRKKTGRKPGRPKGQPGATMELTGHPDHALWLGHASLWYIILTTVLSIGQYFIERYYARGKRGGPDRGWWEVARESLPVFGRTRIDLAGLS